LVGIRFDPERIAEPITQVPGRSCGASPPATPKLIIPGQSPKSVRASAIAAVSIAIKLRPVPPQTTRIPGPAAMRASNASPTTMTKKSPKHRSVDQDRTTGSRKTSKTLQAAGFFKARVLKARCPLSARGGSLCNQISGIDSSGRTALGRAHCESA